MFGSRTNSYCLWCESSVFYVVTDFLDNLSICPASVMLADLMVGLISLSLAFLLHPTLLTPFNSKSFEERLPYLLVSTWLCFSISRCECGLVYDQEPEPSLAHCRKIPPLIWDIVNELCHQVRVLTPGQHAALEEVIFPLSPLVLKS